MILPLLGIYLKTKYAGVCFWTLVKILHIADDKNQPLQEGKRCFIDEFTFCSKNGIINDNISLFTPPSKTVQWSTELSWSLNFKTWDISYRERFSFFEGRGGGPDIPVFSRWYLIPYSEESPALPSCLY